MTWQVAVTVGTLAVLGFVLVFVVTRAVCRTVAWYSARRYWRRLGIQVNRRWEDFL